MPQRKKPNWQYPCGVCENCVRRDSKSIKCDICKKWIHLKCADITLSRYRYLDKNRHLAIPYYCPNCRPGNISANSSPNSTLNLSNSIQLDIPTANDTNNPVSQSSPNLSFRELSSCSSIQLDISTASSSDISNVSPSCSICTNSRTFLSVKI